MQNESCDGGLIGLAAMGQNLVPNTNDHGCRVAVFNLLVDDFFRNTIAEYQSSWRNALTAAVRAGVPTPAFSTALAFYDGFRTARFPANLLQAQRNYFSAHTYECIDKPLGEFFHTNWTGRGGRVPSGAYNV